MAKKRIRLPQSRLSRGWQIVRNLAVALICLYALWARRSYPLPTQELEFRRLERENLLGQSEIQGMFKGNYNKQIVFGVQGDQVVVSSRYAGLSFWPRAEDGPVLVLIEEGGLSPMEMEVIAADVPRGTASARPDMTIDCWFAFQPENGTRISALEGGYPRDDSLEWRQWTRDYQVEGELLKEGGMRFRIPGDPEGTVSIEMDLFWMLNSYDTYRKSDHLRGVNCHMEAVFYDKTGAELGRAALSTPEGGKPMLPDRRKDKWLDTAVSGIKFYLDRRAVRRELEDHFEDRVADLRRLYPDIPEAEAWTRTLANMGDAEEVKQELAKVHKPWLGWLWNASRLALITLWALYFIAGAQSRANLVDYSIGGRIANETVYHRIRDGERAQAGGYTFQITGAAYVDRPEEYGAEDSLQLVLRASTPRFWERIDSDTVLIGLEGAGPDGEWHSMAGKTVLRYTVPDELGNITEYYRILAGGKFARWGLGWKEFSLYVPAEGWQPGDRVAVRFTSELGGFTLSAPVTEKVVVP